MLESFRQWAKQAVTMGKSPFTLFNAELVNELAEQAGRLLPDEKYRDEMQKGMQLIIQNALSRLDIVSREEFDVQTAVLEKTRAKVEALEKQLTELTEKLDQ